MYDTYHMKLQSLFLINLIIDLLFELLQESTQSLCYIQAQATLDHLNQRQTDWTSQLVKKYNYLHNW